MKRIFTLFLLSINFLVFSTQNSWQDSWIAGLEFLENDQYEKAREMFANATSNMSEEELQENPDVLINLAHTDNLLQNNDSVLRETKELLNSYKLSDQQRLICGGLLVSALSAKGEEEEALQAYYKYVTNSPMAPKCLFEENRIIISNIPSCGACRETYKSFFIHQLCENQENFHEYGNVWSFEIKKKCECLSKKNHTTSYQIPKKIMERRNPQTIRGCCNTCSTLGVGAGAACMRIPHFFCQTACLLFVEVMREVCEECCYHGGWEENCWEKFTFWKEDFHKKNKNCPPPDDWL